MVNLLFYFHVILYLEEVASYEKLSRNLTFEVKDRGGDTVKLTN